ncbi:hypothetical protein SVIO_001670 [Streptomyces violaceusniger]|uniref:Uncharacterized protein n=1 Tax=Streptomyces violaceusniger TaxID=68280 RepID=A0A4D4KMW5_STRVO|nr:hypothetical protein SVIO_001670 [Streptomyces violaceusniger]
MMYPLVREPAAAAAPYRVPVAVTCRVPGPARQPYYRWLDRPVADAEMAEAYRADALFDAHRDDPEFGHRFLRPRGPRRRRADGRADRLADLPGQRLVEHLRQAKRPRQEHPSRATGP